MKSKSLAILFSLAAALAVGAPAWAEKVGRTTFDLPAGWSLVTAYEGKMTLDGGARSIPMYHSLYQLPGSGDTPRALLLVSSTDGGFGLNIDWVSEKCPEARPGYFTDDFGGQALKRKRECVVVNSAFSPVRFFNEESGAVKGLEANGLKLFRSGYSMRTVVGARGGTLLRVNLMTQSGFAGLDAAPRAGNLHGVPAPLVAWAESLHAAVDQSVYSLGGGLQLPPITFSR